MRNLRIVRVLIATLFFAASVGFLAIGLTEHPLAMAARHSQVIPSLVSGTLGVSLFWLVVTLIFGRLYCSTVCPIGTLQDLITPLRKYIPGLPQGFRYRRASSARYHILGIYIVCLLAGLAIVPLLLEPWNLMRTICSTVRPSLVDPQWTALGLGTLIGIIAGIVSFLAVAACAIFTGRGFCNTVCPLGTIMGLAENKSLYIIAINPDKCTSCLKCEEVCKASCIKVSERLVDNSRCVRCFDCLAVCDDEAITFRRGPHKPATPLTIKQN